MPLLPCSILHTLLARCVLRTALGVHTPCARSIAVPYLASKFEEKDGIHILVSLLSSSMHPGGRLRGWVRAGLCRTRGWVWLYVRVSATYHQLGCCSRRAPGALVHVQAKHPATPPPYQPSITYHPRRVPSQMWWLTSLQRCAI